MHSLQPKGSSPIKALAAALLMAASAPAGAEGFTENWHFGLVAYGWLPNVDGKVRFPSGSGDDVEADASDIIDNLQFTFMASFEARKGAWSGFTDVIYLDLQGDDSKSVTVRTGATRTALDADLEMKGWIWTLGGAYSVWRDGFSHLDLLAGARLLSLDNRLKLSGGGPLQRDRKLTKSVNLWDGIVGAKGRIALTDHWFLPYYADLGTGDSDLTWQAFGGVGYAFRWGEVSLTYRYLSYDQGDDKPLQDISFGGPKLGVGFRF